MAQTSGFFNAFLSGGVYDRTYNADHYCDNLATIIKNGVSYIADDKLKVSAHSGMTIKVGTGRAWINGHWYHNDTAYTGLIIETAPSGSNARIDRVVLRLDRSTAVRSITLAVKTGTAASTPVPPALTRTSSIYELGLADIYVGAGVVTISNENITDLRDDGNYCGWASSVTPAVMSMIQRYQDQITLTSAGKVVQFNIAQYDSTEAGAVLDVFVNGIYETQDKYTISGNIITFSGELIAGTVVDVVLLKSIDATGLVSAAEKLAELEQTVHDLYGFNEYHYMCNGVDDNIKLSGIAQKWISGGTDYGCLKIRVYGNVGISAAYGGLGTASNPYRWFSFGKDTQTNRKVEFDFSCTGQITVPISAGTSNYIFYGEDITVTGANVVANQSGANTKVDVFSGTSGAVFCEDCRFWVTVDGDACVARTGTFRNCRMSITSVSGNAFCFSTGANGLLRVYGGEFYAYVGSSSNTGAVVRGASSTSVTMLYGLNCPTAARSGYTQTYAVYITSGLASLTDTVTELSISAAGANIRGTLAVSKPGMM